MCISVYDFDYQIKVKENLNILIPNKFRNSSIATSDSPLLACGPLIGKQSHNKVHIHGQILVTLKVLPAPLKHMRAVSENFTHALAGSPQQTVILADYSLKSDQVRVCSLYIRN